MTVRFVYKKEVGEDVDWDKLKKELLEFSQYADLENQESVGNLLDLIGNLLPVHTLTYVQQVGLQTSLVAALSIIRNLLIKHHK